jgi:intraflagellar transport protein 56
MQEYILKAVAHAAKGQKSGDPELVKIAQQYFQLVGASASECDTIPGRQCMASCFYLLRQFDDVNMFLTSIQQYFKDDDDYNWNYGMALSNTGSWKEVQINYVVLARKR